MHRHNYTCYTISLLLEALGAAVISFWQCSTPQQQRYNRCVNADALSHSQWFLFFVPLSSMTERKPSRTVQTTGGLCANMIRANRDCQTTNKDRARQKETFRKRIIGKQKHGKGVE